MKKIAITIIVVAVAIASAYFILHFLFIGPSVVPVEFSTARQNGAKLAEEVAFLTSKSLEGLKEIAKYDTDQNYAEALTSVSRELMRNRDINERAIQLSTELARMAEAVPNVRPAKGRELASEAITYEVALVSRLIGYNGNLRDLFEFLRAKFSGQVPVASSQLSSLLEEVNASATAINGLNTAFNETLKKFDELYR